MKKLLMLCLCLALLCGAVPAQGEETELRVLTYYLNDEWVQGFEQAHPGVRVIVDDSMSVQDALVTGLPVDVIVTATDTSFADMVQKGYVRPLEDQALAARFQRLLPPLRQALTVSGQPYGFPSGLLLETWTLNVTPYEEVGFQDADAPATVAAFLDQLRLWIEDLRAEHTGYFFCEGCDLPSMLRLFTRQYVMAHENADTALSFGTAEYRTFLSEMDGARDLFQENQADMDAVAEGLWDKWPLMYNYNQYFGYGYNDDSLVRSLQVPALSDEASPITEGRADVMTVSAGSAHPDLAEAFILYCAEHAEDVQQYALYADLTEPLPNPYFDQAAARQQENIDTLTRQLENCREEDREGLTTQLEDARERLARFTAESRYSITERDIALYASIVSHLTVPTGSLYLNGDSNCAAALDGYLERFADGELDADQLIAEMDRTCKLAFMEK